MEPIRKNSSSLQTKSRCKMCLSVDTSCCHYISSPIRKPFNAQTKKWWSFKKSSNNATTILQGTTPSPDCSDAALTRPCPRPRPELVSSHCKRKQALAVAVASVAAAEAAVVAAEAAAHMAHLTLTPSRCSRRNLHAENLAAIKIQSAFRGYLVRKALRIPSKAGLARLQAIAHGRVAQMQCGTTMQCMQAFIRAQKQPGIGRQPRKHQLWVKQTPIDTSACMRDTSQEIYHESVATPLNTEQLADKEMQPIHGEAKLHWNWLEHWMANRLQGSLNCHSPKYVRKSSLSQPQPVPTPRHATNWSSRPSRQLRYHHCSSASSNASGDGQSVASFSGLPHYMADTESTRAKVRAHSAPKQRIEAKYIPLGSNSPLQQQSSPFLHQSSMCHRHLSHMMHSEHHHASTKRRF